MAVTVAYFDEGANIVHLASDAEDIASQRAELMGPNMTSIAIDHAVQLGYKVAGARETHGRNIRFFDRTTQKELSQKEILDVADDESKEKIQLRRIVLLGMDYSGATSLPTKKPKPVAEVKSEPVIVGKKKSKK